MRKQVKQSKSAQSKLEQRRSSAIRKEEKSHSVTRFTNPVNPNSSTQQENMDILALLSIDPEKAFSQIISREGNLLYSLALEILDNHHSAQDVVQETYLKAYEALTQYTKTRLRALQIRAWLSRIVINTAKNYRDKEHRDLYADLGVLLEQEDKRHEQPEASVLCEEELSGLYHLLLKLSSPYQSIMILRFACDFSYEEIAEMLNLPIGTVGTYIIRAREKLEEIVRYYDFHMDSSTWTRLRWEYKLSAFLTPESRSSVTRILDILSETYPDKDDYK